MTTLQASAQRQLNQFISQIENLETEKKALADDIAAKYAEAKSTGFDTRAMKKIIKLRKQTKQQRDEEEAVLATYMAACGLLGSPLGEWADKQEANSNVVRL